MKKNMMKLGVVAALMMAGLSAANAAITVTFKGEVAKGTCNTVLQNGTSTVNLPTLLPTDFGTTPGIVASSESSPLTIFFNACQGADLATGDFLTMRALPVATQDPTLTTNNLWGDKALGWGIVLNAETTGAGLPNTGAGNGKHLTPNDNAIQITVAATSPTSEVTLTPSPVKVAAALSSYVPKAQVQSGINTAVVEFSSVYN